MAKWVQKFQDLEVYQQSYSLAMEVFGLTRSFPKEETYSLTDQLRRSSRSVSANIAESWGRRRYRAAFTNCLVTAQSEAYETENWLQFASGCGYLDPDVAEILTKRYEKLVYSVGSMILHAEEWSTA